jgi:hypothetical protein
VVHVVLKQVDVLMFQRKLVKVCWVEHIFRVNYVIQMIAPVQIKERVVWTPVDVSTRVKQGALHLREHTWVMARSVLMQDVRVLAVLTTAIVKICLH